jgi:hypothetical protein
MSLDTKQKRGSATLISLPFRPWLANPDGTLSAADRLSVMRYAGAIAPLVPVVLPLTYLTHAGSSADTTTRGSLETTSRGATSGRTSRGRVA